MWQRSNPAARKRRQKHPAIGLFMNAGRASQMWPTQPLLPIETCRHTNDRLMLPGACTWPSSRNLRMKKSARNGIKIGSVKGRRLAGLPGRSALSGCCARRPMMTTWMNRTGSYGRSGAGSCASAIGRKPMRCALSSMARCRPRSSSFAGRLRALPRPATNRRARSSRWSSMLRRWRVSWKQPASCRG